MRKYWFVYSLYWQEGLQQRASFFMERFRALVVLISFYFFWSTLLGQREELAGYSRAAMMTYLFGMNLFRGLVFASRADEIAYEISHGRLAGYLIKPVNFFAYAFSRDLAEKSTNLVSALIEVSALVWLLREPLDMPGHPVTWILFPLALVGAVILYYLLGFILGCWAFWTAESGGPRFLFELTLEFTAGAFFPLDILPDKIQSIFKLFPSPYLVYFPLNLFLERMTTKQIVEGFAVQVLWILFMAAAARILWFKGLSVYAAEGS